MVTTSWADWQHELISRLQGGLGRELVLADFACLSWDVGGGALRVDGQPLLAELRLNNLVSNVFRRSGRSRQ
jgi:hypothetical protein